MSKHKKPNHNPPPAAKQDEAKKETTNRHVYVEPGVQIDLVDNLKQKYEADQRDKKAHDKKQLFWTKVGAGLVAFYALLTFGLLVVGKWQLKQIEQTNRPYVVASPHYAVEPAKDFHDLSFTVQLFNAGISPATEVHATDVEVVIDGDAGVREKMKSCSFTYGPGKFAIAAGQNPEINTMVLPTRTTRFIPDDEKSLLGDKENIYIFGAAKYSGPLGGNFETAYCFRWNGYANIPNNLPFGTCPAEVACSYLK